MHSAVVANVCDTISLLFIIYPVTLTMTFERHLKNFDAVLLMVHLHKAHLGFLIYDFTAFLQGCKFKFLGTPNDPARLKQLY